MTFDSQCHVNCSMEKKPDVQENDASESIYDFVEVKQSNDQSEISVSELEELTNNEASLKQKPQTQGNVQNVKDELNKKSKEENEKKNTASKS